MKILLVSWSILPRAGGSSIVVDNLRRGFGASEMIVLGSKPLLNAQYRAANTSTDSPAVRYFLSEMQILGRGNRFFEWFGRWRFPALVRTLTRIIKTEQIDVVIGVYPNANYCLAACRAAEQTGVPFNAYFHNTYQENQAIQDPGATQIQQEIFEQARFIFVMSEGMQQYYRKQYPAHADQFIPLVHTFHEYPDKNQLTGIPGPNREQYKLIGIGNFNASNIEATCRFARAVSLTPSYNLSLFTHVPGILLQKRGLDPKLYRHMGFLKNADDIIGAIQDFDIGVVTHGFTGSYGKIEYETIFPSRMIPLLLSGKPLIVHAPAGSYLHRFVDKNQCAELIDRPEEEAILEGLDRICRNRDYQDNLVRAAGLTVRQFYGPKVVHELKQRLIETQKSTYPKI